MGLMCFPKGSSKFKVKNNYNRIFYINLIVKIQCAFLRKVI